MNYQRRHDTIAIIGSHPRTRAEFDFSRDDCDVWVFNEAVKTETNKAFAPADRVSGVFQMHEEAIWKNPHNRNDNNHYKWLQETSIPVFMQDEYKDVPASIKYPLDEIARNLWAQYFTSSVSYALALAIYLEYERIEIYGVEMETNTEYQYQRDCVTYWIGYARGRGIEVKEFSKLFDAPLYGYEGEVTLSYEDITKRIEELTPECDRLKKLYEGQHEKVSKAIDTVVTTGLVSDGKVFSTEFIELLKMGQEFGHVDGARQENERYKKKADAMKEIAGEFLFSRQEFEGSTMAHAKGMTDCANISATSAGTFEALFNNMIKCQAKKTRIKHMTRAAPHMEAYVRESVKASMYAGALEENKTYINKLDKLIRAAGGARSEEVLLQKAGRNV